MNWNTPVARKLYLRIWLAVAGSVAVLSLLVGWAWHVAERERERERERQPVPARQVVVRNAAGQVISDGEAQFRRQPGQPGELVVSLQDGQVVTLQMGPRSGRPGTTPQKIPGRLPGRGSLSRLRED